jgi:hypothetical protein
MYVRSRPGGNVALQVERSAWLWHESCHMTRLLSGSRPIATETWEVIAGVHLVSSFPGFMDHLLMMIDCIYASTYMQCACVPVRSTTDLSDLQLQPPTLT